MVSQARQRESARTRFILLVPAVALITAFAVAPPLLHAEPTFLSRPAATTFRLMSYNPYWDSIFSDGLRRYDRAAEFGRILAAVDPDIVCLQEIDPDRDASALVGIFNRILPLPDGEQWVAARGADNAIVSRYPIVWTTGEVVQGRGVRARGHVLALIDLPDHQHTGDALVVGTHFTSGGSSNQIAARTRHADALVAAIRQARTTGAVPLDTALVIAGDVNAYGTDPRRHLDTLVTGDIDNDGRYGPDASLDPAGLPMIDLLPFHNSTADATWTWRDDTQEFEPYALDRIIYTGSSLVAVHSLVLNTAVMSRQELDRHGLEAGDVALNLHRGEYDHLPLVVDFSLRQ